MRLLHLIFKWTYLVFLLFICTFANAYSEERIDLLCVSFSESDSVYQKQAFTLDSLIVNSETPCIIVSYPNFPRWENTDIPHLAIFTPVAFPKLSEDVIHEDTVNRGSLQNQPDRPIHRQEKSVYPPMMVSNFFYKSSNLSFIDHYIVTYSDSVKLGFLGIASPDLPHLTKNVPANSLMRFDIFDCAKEMSTLLSNQKVSGIISLNYLGDFLDRELLQRVPEISFIIDTFEEKGGDYIITDSILHLSPKSNSIVDVQLYISNGKLQRITTQMY